MKKRIIISAATAAVSIFLYPITSNYAATERGYNGVFGGEEIFLLFGLIAAVYILFDGLQKNADKKKRR